MTDGCDQILCDRSANLEIRLSEHPTAEIIDLLQRTVWGSQNLRYRILDIDAKLEQLVGPHYLRLEMDNRLASVCVLNRRPSRLLDLTVDSFHFVMLATEPDFARQGLASRLAEQAVLLCRNRLKEPGIAYAYIEATTDYSLQISEAFEREYQATVPLTLFSRFWPSDDQRVALLDSNEKDAVVARLSALYSDHLLADFTVSLNPDQYYVIWERDEIVAGVQIQMLNWSMASLPGWLGALTLKLIPYAPMRFPIDPSNVRFLRFSNLLVEPERERYLIRLLETVLARHGVSVGLLLLDERSDVFRRLSKFGKTGLLRHAFGGDAMAVFGCQGLSGPDVDHLHRHPILMSPLDIF